MWQCLFYENVWSSSCRRHSWISFRFAMLIMRASIRAEIGFAKITAGYQRAWPFPRTRMHKACMQQRDRPLFCGELLALLALCWAYKCVMLGRMLERHMSYIIYDGYMMYKYVQNISTCCCSGESQIRWYSYNSGSYKKKGKNCNYVGKEFLLHYYHTSTNMHIWS